MSEQVFVKYCPLCGAENPRQSAFCLSCFDGDLSTVPVELRRKGAAKPAPEVAVAAPNAADAPAPTPDVPAECDPKTAQVTQPDEMRLELVDDPAIRFTVRDGQTVGRTEKAAVILAGVPKSEWISGAHARFFRRGTQWYIQHIAETNYIKVDGETFRGREEVAVYDGSIVVLSLTSFRIGIGT